jgi:hypothetical protein
MTRPPSKHLKTGDRAPVIVTPSIDGTPVKVPDPQDGLTHSDPWLPPEVCGQT